MLRPITNPAHRFRAEELTWEVPPDLARPQVYLDDSRSILSRNDSPDLAHRWSVNPYRGCMHACTYCYARPSHEYLGFGAGTDHDTKILVKLQAPALLEAAFEARSWEGEVVLFSGNTDCYQPMEHHYRLTRACLEVCLRYRNPVSIITKSALIERDLDLLVALTREARVHVIFSVPFWDPAIGRAIEPGAPSPERRLRAMHRLAEAGVVVGVNLAPIIPGLNDRDIPHVLQAARAAGATKAAMILVRLHAQVAPFFTERLAAALPDRAPGVLARLRRARGGAVSSPRFGDRMTGAGPEWQAVEQLFELWVRRLGYERRGYSTQAASLHDEAPTTFRRPPRAGQQATLFPRPP